MAAKSDQPPGAVVLPPCQLLHDIGARFRGSIASLNSKLESILDKLETKEQQIQVSQHSRRWVQQSLQEMLDEERERKQALDAAVDSLRKIIAEALEVLGRT